MALEFEWDEEKRQANIRKHGVDFLEAAEVFADPFLLIEYDDEHSSEEDRYIALGMSGRSVILIVVHTDRLSRIRIISARLAVRSEVARYEADRR